MKKAVIILLCCLVQETVRAQHVKDFFYLDQEHKQLPVLVRGNPEGNIILLFVQGGPGETAIDFARADYPRWKKTLEQKVLVAYYDQRGLNSKRVNIESSTINFDQYSQDILDLTMELKSRYNSRIYLLGHSAGGYFIYHALATLPQLSENLEGAIVMNTPITTDFSPDRYQYYRPLYLKNLSLEFVEQGINPEYWQRAYDWMIKTDSIHSPETSAQWNFYVDQAFNPTKRRIGPFTAFGTVVSRPYGFISYLNRKDNKLVGDLLWECERDLNIPELLLRIRVPVLLITGRYDDIAPPEEISVADKLLINSQAFIIQHAGHEVFLDQGNEVNRLILNWLKFE